MRRTASRSTRDVGEMDATFWELRATCALGRVLELGCGTGQFVRRLLEHGVDAFGTDADSAALAEADRLTPGRCRPTQGARVPFDDDAFDTIVCVNAWPHRRDIGSLAAEIRRVATRHVFLRITPRAEDDAAVGSRTREWWDARFFHAGFRLHPSLLQVGIDGDHDASFLLLFEKIPDAQLARYPQPPSADDCDRRVDMLRETGRVRDAHLRRYALAAGLVRPNDIVIDASCGLGYGVAMMGAAGRARRVIGVDASAEAIEYASRMYGDAAGRRVFYRGDAHTLSAIPDRSVDLVVSFETAGHPARLTDFLENVERVLKPGGRFVGSIPIVEPHRCENLFAAPWIIESSSADVPGSVVVAMKDPRVGAGVPYEETVHAVAPGAHRPAAVSFSQAYDNPWIRNAMVSQGIRVSDPALLRTLAAQIENASASGSVDRAAMLCVQGYQMLELADADALEARETLGRIESWLTLEPAVMTTHHLRWRISLEFLAARICLYAGMRAEALRWFEQCAARDARQFSPLLATKTVEAAYMAGVMHAWNHEAEPARLAWLGGLNQARAAVSGDWREIVGDPAHPLSFGLRELGQVLNQAARCAAGLNALDDWQSAPGKLAERLRSDCRADAERVRELATGRQLRSRAVESHSHQDRESVRPEACDAASTRVVVHGAGDAGCRIWESLVKRPGVEVVAFVDPDDRRQRRTCCGLGVHPIEWLRGAEWDRVAVSATVSTEWRFSLAAAGVSPRQCLEFPEDADDATCHRIAATMFPDPLATAIDDAGVGDGLRVGIFGTGAAGLKVWEAIAGIDAVETVWFTDNNPAQQGTRMLGLDVFAPARAARQGCDAVIVGSMSRDPIRRQLLELGFPEAAIWTPDVAAPVDHIRTQIERMERTQS